MNQPATVRYAKENYVTGMPLSWWEGHLVGQVVRQTAIRMRAPVLDLGSGCGVVTAMSNRHHPTIGVDISTVALAKARDATPGKLVQAAAAALPFRDGAFGGAYAFEVLEHIYPSDQRRVHHELQRVLKPKAQLVGTVPILRASAHSAHVAFFLPRTLRKLLTTSGWRVRFCGLLPLPVDYGGGKVIGCVAQK